MVPKTVSNTAPDIYDRWKGDAVIDTDGNNTYAVAVLYGIYESCIDDWQRITGRAFIGLTGLSHKPYVLYRCQSRPIHKKYYVDLENYETTYSRKQYAGA